jgi:PcfJ-like protein
MNPHHGHAAARPSEPLTPVILAGRAWTARQISNNCLRQHCHALTRVFRRGDFVPLKQTCARIFRVLETRSRVLLDIHPNELAVVAAVARLGAYADQWLREPEDWQPNPDSDAKSQWADFLRHLLADYPVPSFLDEAWLAKGPLRHFERDCWCALGYGRSLRMVEGLPPSVSSRVLHLALESGHTSMAQAIWSAQLQCLGPSAALKSAIMTSRVPEELSHHALWVRLAAKFVASTDVAASQFAPVADSLAALKAHRGEAQVEMLMRLPLTILTRHCMKFITELLQANGHLLTEEQVRLAAENASLSRLAASRWQPMLGGFSLNASWKIEELCSVEDLKAEGKAMRHCVAGYARRCRQGSSAIFSVRRLLADFDGTTKSISYATLEVHPSQRKIVQIRAFGNRPANQTIMNFIREWARKNDLIC